MHIVYAASECAPWARTGGLGEVLRALPRQIAAMGHKVSVFIPYYRQVREFAHAQSQSSDKNYAVRSITIPFLGYSRFASILDGGKQDGVQMYFVDCPELFDREFLYGSPAGEYQDNWERYALFCRAVVEATKVLGAPDVYHVHDWQTALLPVYLRTLYEFDPVLRNRGTVLTVHNAGYQGRWSPATVERLLFPWTLFTIDRAEFYGQFNYLKAGLVFADRLTTVSPRYAEEIQTHEYGQQLDGVFRQRAADLRGILNGLDYNDWNPAHDGNIAAHYNPENLAGKADCRRDLLHAFGVPPQDDSTAVLGTVTRLTTQKGIDILAQVAEPLSRENVVLLALGTGEEYYENLMRSLAAKYPGKVYTRIGYDVMLAHKVEAGADMFLMPSRYEPCGLGQLCALKYGAVPIVRATGGLDSTVEEWNPAARTGNGFKFQGLEPEEFLAAIQRALTVFRDDKEAWHTLMHNGMTEDHSWTTPAGEYLKVYEQVVTSRN
ncbi:MAG TPA: glycogen synthase GlgA [Acidobacteriaceae bacterium]|nr:glycogen synthase GlgA [Acidobacteriaceae bacterium]